MAARARLRRSIGLRLWFSFGGILAGVLVLGALGLTGMRRMARQVEESLRRQVVVAATVSDLRVIARETTLLLKSMSASASTTDLERVQADREQFEAALSRMGSVDPARLAELRRRFTTVAATGERLVRATASQDWDQAGELSVAFTADSKALDAELASLDTGQREVVEGELAAITSDIALRTQLFAGGLVVLMLLALVLAFRIRRSLATPLAQLTAATRGIAEQGDLTARIVITDSGDEVGELGATFKAMVEKLRTITVELRGATGRLGESAQHLTSVASAQGEMVSRQAAALQQTQVTTAEIRQTSTTAAEQASAVLAVAERAAALGRAGQSAIEKSLAGMTAMRTQFAETASDIAALAERTEQIATIITTVKELADQSQMLALNAAIEAARAGEHGRGFTVVARQIRGLADQSIQATLQIKGVLGEIGKGIVEAVRSVERNTQAMEAGYTDVHASGASLRELADIVSENLAAARQIAQAVGQQNEGIGQVSTAMLELNQMASEAVRRLHQTEQAASVVREVSNQVSEAVRIYRV